MTERPCVLVLLEATGEPPPGIDVVAMSAELVTVRDDATFADAADAADVVFAWDARRRWLERLGEAPRLRWMQAASDGVDHLLVPSLVARTDVVVTNARGIFDPPIAEWVIGAILAMVTGLHRSIVDQAARRWTVGRRTQRLDGTHLLVVGPGPIGRETAARARALGMTVAAVGRTARLDPVLGDVVGGEGFRDALARADVVLDALPLTPKTRGTFDADAFAAMRPGTRFLNVGRGETVVEAALVDALRSGHLGGAALDVFETEPLPDGSPLWSLPNVIVSPHISGDVEGYEEQTVALFLDNLGRFIRGEPLRNLVDVRAGFGIGDAAPR